MSKVASVIFPNSSSEYKVEYFDKDENAVQAVLNLVKVHQCKVILLHGFTEEEMNLLEKINGVSIHQYN